MFIRPELGGKVQDVYFSLHTVAMGSSLIAVLMLIDDWLKALVGGSVTGVCQRMGQPCLNWGFSLAMS